MLNLDGDVVEEYTPQLPFIQEIEHETDEVESIGRGPPVKADVLASRSILKKQTSLRMIVKAMRTIEGLTATSFLMFCCPIAKNS